MHIATLIGIVGALILLLMWLLETYRSVKSHKSELAIVELFLYFVGTAMLSFYAFNFEDPVFFPLYTVILIFVAFELVYAIHFKFKKRKRLYGNRSGGKNKRR